MRLITATVLLVGGLAPVGCGQAGSAQSCSQAGQCAPAGDALCVGGSCLLFAPDEYTSVVLNISFPRDMSPVPASGRIFVLDRRRADGGEVLCQELLDGSQSLDDPGLNTLLAQPRYLVFNCCGTYFPNNLVQFIRPVPRALLVGEGFSQQQAQGQRLAAGCLEQLSLSAGQQQELTLPMQALE